MIRATFCPREEEVLDLVVIGQWPARADASLREHVATCHLCADLAVVASSVSDLSEATKAESALPDAALVWYRAQVRAREEKTRRASRPVLIAEISAVVCLLTLGAIAWRLGDSWLTDWWTTMQGLRLPTVTSLTDLVWIERLSGWWWIFGALIVWALLLPGAFYLARLADRFSEPQTDQHNRI